MVGKRALALAIVSTALAALHSALTPMAWVDSAHVAMRYARRISDHGTVTLLGQAEPVEQVHLEMNAEIAFAAAAEDRAFEIGARVDTPLVQAGRQFGVETDECARHAPAHSRLLIRDG